MRFSYYLESYKPNVPDARVTQSPQRDDAACKEFKMQNYTFSHLGFKNTHKTTLNIVYGYSL